MIASTTKPNGFTIQLRDLIQYGEEGVRRQIVTKDEKRQAILVCLTAGTHLSSHSSSHDGFIIAIDGQGVFTLEGEDIALEPGVFIAMPANVVHSVKAIDNLAFLKVVDRHDTCQEHL